MCSAYVRKTRDYDLFVNLAGTGLSKRSAVVSLRPLMRERAKKEKRMNDEEEKANLLGTTFKLAVQARARPDEGRPVVASFQVSLTAPHIQRAVTLYPPFNHVFYSFSKTFLRGGRRAAGKEREREAGDFYLETNKLCFFLRRAGRWDGRDARRSNEVAGE